MKTCPKFEDAPEAIRAEYELDGVVFPPTCPGKYLKGSGGHRMHDGSCFERATWWHPDDSYAYCDVHCPERDKPAFLRLWAPKEPQKKTLDSIIIEVCPQGFRVATYFDKESNEPGSVGGTDRPAEVLEMIARILGVPCPEWMPREPESE